MKDVSYWLDGAYEPRKDLDRDIKADVVVIGGGITGVSAAYHCAKKGLKTVLIEKNEMASGSAGKNGGMVVEGLAIDFISAAKKWGLEKAIEAWRLTRDAREQVCALVAEHGIDCDFSRAGSFYVGLSGEDEEWLKDEQAARRDAGFHSSNEDPWEEFPSSGFAAALFVPDDCMLHPVKFIRGLAQAGESLGLEIYENTAAIRYDKHSVTASHGTIRADKVVLAIESGSDIPESVAQIGREAAFITEPLGDEDLRRLDWKRGGMMWTSGESYLAVRHIGDRLFINGDMDADPSPGQLDRTRKTLTEEFLRYFPRFDKEKLIISHQWTGLVMDPSSFLPHIAVRNGAYEIYGQGGNGLTNGIMTGKSLADHFAGEDNPKIYWD